MGILILPELKTGELVARQAPDAQPSVSTFTASFLWAN